MQLPLIILFPGSSDTLHHATEVHPQPDQSNIHEEYPWEVSATSPLAPKIGPLGLSPKKFGDNITKATND